MKREWILQLVVLAIFYLDSIIEVDHNEIYVSETLGIDFLFLLYHALLFLLVNYVLIPRLFYRKRYVAFVLSLIASIIAFAVLEEGVVEQILAPHSRGRDPLRWVSIYWFFGEILIPLLAFMSIKFMFDNFEQQQQLKQIEKDKLSNELKFLKSQIQPHILFNSLNNLYDFTLAKSDKAPDLVLHLSNVLRYVLYETATEKVPLSKELSFVKDYIALQQMQFEGRGVVEFELKEKAANNSLHIAPFLLIPFIENGIKHSFGSKEQGVRVHIELHIEGQQLYLLVINNFEKNGDSSNDLIHKGIGLKNVQKRLDLLYPEQHQLHIEEKAMTYTVQLHLNLT